MKTSHRQSRTLARAAALALAFAAPHAGAAQAVAPPNYGPYTATAFLPYAGGNDPAFAGTVHVAFTIAGKPFRPVMDTGSTGVIVSAYTLLGDSVARANRFPVGYEFLSSSKILWAGHWVPEDLVYVDQAGRRVVAHVPVLAVDSAGKCPGYRIGVDGAHCPGVRLGRPDATLQYMGVGFGREHNGQTQGTPDKNPFLNVVSIGGTRVRPGSMRAGYVVTRTGVHVGLTAANTRGFAYEQLTRPAPLLGSMDWNGASMCVQVNGSACAQGSVLVDTGIDQMYLTMTPGIPVHTVPVRNPSTGNLVPGLPNGARVRVSFPNAASPMAFYTFVVGGANPMQPTVALVNPAATPAFVNTGRHFLRDFDVLFDAVGGLYGLRWTGPANSPWGGLVTARH